MPLSICVYITHTHIFKSALMKLQLIKCMKCEKFIPEYFA